VKEKISSTNKGGAGNERRAALRAEMDAVRGKQAGNKNSRGKIFEQLTTLQEGIQKKVYFTIILCLGRRAQRATGGGSSSCQVENILQDRSRGRRSYQVCPHVTHKGCASRQFSIDP
jgi:hypothetical protein